MQYRGILSASPAIKRSINYENTVYHGKQNDIQWIKELKIYRDHAILSKTVNSAQEVEEANIGRIIQNAQLHRRAVVPSDCRNLNEDQKQSKKCPCCDKIQGIPIHPCCKKEQLYFLGQSTSHYFLFHRISLIMIAITVVVYSIFAFTSNIMGQSAQELLDQCKDGIYCRVTVLTSMINKLKWDLALQTQYWLGVPIVFIWIAMKWIMDYQGDKMTDEIQYYMQSPSRKAIKIQNLPAGLYTQQTLKTALQTAWLSRQRKRANQRCDRLSIKSVHIVYNMEHFRQLVKKIHKESLLLWQCFEGNDLVVEPKKLKVKVDKYLNQKTDLRLKIDQLQDARTRFSYQQQFRRKLSTQCAIVEFQTSEDQKDFMKVFNKISRSSIFEVIFNFSASLKKRMGIEFHDKDLIIEGAAEPEDFYWENAQKPYNYRISIPIIGGAGLVIVLTGIIYFAIDYGQELLSNNQDINEYLISFLGYVKSGAIYGCNIGIWLAIQAIISKDKTHTLTQKQIRLYTLSTLTETVNCILVPIIYQLITKNDMYSGQGVAGSALNFAIINTVLGNAQVLFLNVTCCCNVLCTKIRCFRNCRINRHLKNVDYIKQGHIIKSTNQFYQRGEFDVIQSYSSLTIDLYHMAFYASMQPLICLVLLANIIIKLMIKKCLLLRYCNYPNQYGAMLFNHMILMFSFLPLFYSAGMLVTIYLSNIQNQKKSLYLPFGISLGLYFFIDPLIGYITFQIFRCVDKKKTRVRAAELQQQQPTGNIVQNQSESQIQLADYAQYFQTSNLLDLLGYENKLKSGEYSKEDKQEVQRFTNSFWSSQNSSQQI